MSGKKERQDSNCPAFFGILPFGVLWKMYT